MSHPKISKQEWQTSPDKPQPGERVGQFEIIRELGTGGMGVVCLARDIRLGRLVALKFLLATRAADLNQRFVAEARTTARCNHENIVTLYDVGKHRGHLYMALEYLRGRSLRQWLRAHVPVLEVSSDRQVIVHAPLPVPQVLDIMMPVVRALVYAHDMGLVHRDIKPENIMITESSVVKVLDFGIARPTFMLDAECKLDTNDNILARAFEQSTGGTSGTRPYMAPEQLRGQNVDGQSDVWAVGIVMAELVTGQHPMQQGVLKHADVNAPLPKMAEAHPGLDLGTLGGIVDRCLIKDKAHRTKSAKVLLEELEGLTVSRAPPAVVREEGPFAGLSAFQDSDADRFFGREREVQRLVAQLRTQPWLALAGPSGAGKSSLVRAGIVPALKRSGEGWNVMIVRPGRTPLLALAEGLAQLSTRSPSLEAELPRDLAARFQAEPGVFGMQLRQYCRTTERRFLVFVDQFEELYTLGASAEDRRAFGACLEGTADDAASPLRVIVTLRSDFMHRATEDGGFVATFLRSLVFLAPMKKEGLRAALTQPLEAYGYRFESSSLLDTMLEDLTAVSGVLPLLQFTASRLWVLRDESRRILTEQSYHDFGGVAGALAAHADTVLEAMPPAHRRLARALCLQLVTPEHTRALVSMDELPQGDEGRSVLNRLIEARLLAVTQGPDDDAATVELVHESLIERWPRLSEWLEEDHEETAFCARLRIAAKAWDGRDRMDALLWQGPLAEEAQRWHSYWDRLGGAREGLGDRDISFLNRVVALASQSRRRRQRRVTAVVALLVLVATFVSGLAWQADERAQYAEAQLIKARNAIRMAVARENAADPTLAFALVREMNPAYPLPRWRDFARWARQKGVAEVVLDHPDIVNSVAFSPDGRLIVTASWDRMVRIWSADGTGVPRIFQGHLDRVNSASFSPDGTRIVTASWDKTVRIWNVDGTGAPVVFEGHLDRVNSASFSPDGTRIVTASWDRTVRIWNADGTGAPVVFEGHLDRVNSASFSPDGTRIVTASWDKTARVWNVDGAEAPLVLKGHLEHVYSASFSPDGTRIVTASWDKTARVWNADGTGSPVVFKGDLDNVYSAGFSPDSRRIVTASFNKTATIWNADGTGTPLVFQGHLDRVNSAAFSPDGRRIATASFDKTARIWNVAETGAPLVFPGHLAGVYSAAFSPDGDRIVTASSDKTARIWNADGTGIPSVFRGHLDIVNSAAFSPDGRRIVTASFDKTARIWNADGTGVPLVFQGHSDRVNSAVFSPDGRRIVTASFDKTARIWYADGTGAPLVLQGHSDRVNSAAFSPDGRRIVTASFDRTARIWNADGTGTPLVLQGHLDSVYSAAFSPDGARVVTASLDKTARVWNADGTGMPVVLRGHESLVLTGAWGGQGAFSPDGSQLVTISDDKTIRLWNI